MRRFIQRFKFLFTIHKSIPFLYEFFRTKEVKLGKKLFFSIMIISYIFIPIDVIPDFIAIFGIVDDITFVLFLLQLMVKVAPDSLKEKYRKLH